MKTTNNSNKYFFLITYIETMCQRFSECDVPIQDLACKSSSEHNLYFKCDGAIDNIPDTAWIKKEFGDEKPWIRLNFGNVYKVENIEFVHHSNISREMFKDVVLEFDGYVKDKVVLDNTRATTINLTRISTFVKITGITSHDDHFHHNGFSEIKIFGCYEGK